MAIEIVDFPIKNGDFPLFFVGLPEGIVGRSFFHISVVVEKSCGSLGILTISKAQFPTSGRLIPQALEVW